MSQLLRLRNRAIATSHTLMSLLESHVEVCDRWEDHLTRLHESGYKGTGESGAAHTAYQTDYLIPLMEACRAANFTYAELIDIMPGAFETTYAQRQAILEDLRSYVLDISF